MFQVKQSAASKAPVSLVFSTDGMTPVTGKTGSDATVTYCKADGTTANYAGTGTLTEITANAFSGTGTYQLTIPTAVTDVLGPLMAVVLVTGAKPFKLFFDIVANLASDVYTRSGAPAGASLSADIAALKTELDTVNTSVGASLGSNVSAVKSKTDNLPSDPADESLLEAAITAAASPLATASSITTLATNVTNTHSDVSSVLGMVDTLLTIATGRWKIDAEANQLVLYADDGTTPAYTFDLLDSDGTTPSATSIYERVPVGVID